MEKKRFGVSPLIAAIQSKDLSAVQHALDQGSSLEERDIHGFPGLPLRTACFVGDVAIVKELIKRGADLNAPTGEGPGAPINLAMRAGHREIVSLLLANNSPIPYGVEIPANLLKRADEIAKPPAEEKTPLFDAFDPLLAPPEISVPPSQTVETPPKDDNMLEFVDSITSNALLQTRPALTYDHDYQLLSEDFGNRAAGGAWEQIEPFEDARISGRRSREI